MAASGGKKKNRRKERTDETSRRPIESRQGKMKKEWGDSKIKKEKVKKGELARSGNICISAFQRWSKRKEGKKMRMQRQQERE